MLKITSVLPMQDVFYGLIFEDSSDFFVLSINPSICKICQVQDGVFNFKIQLSGINNSFVTPALSYKLVIASLRLFAVFALSLKLTAVAFPGAWINPTSGFYRQVERVFTRFIKLRKFNKPQFKFALRIQDSTVFNRNDVSIVMARKRESSVSTQLLIVNDTGNLFRSWPTFPAVSSFKLMPYCGLNLMMQLQFLIVMAVSLRVWNLNFPTQHKSHQSAPLNSKWNLYQEF